MNTAMANKILACQLCYNHLVTSKLAMKNRHTNKELDLLQLLSIFVCLVGAGCGSGGGGAITFV